MTSSPYINHFAQPDTIIPDLSNPQSWNRYSYVQNNPIRFNDPTGHMRDDGATGGCNASTCDYVPPIVPVTQPEVDDEPWEYETTITHGLHIGPTSEANIPDYYGDYEYNTNVPYIHGVSPRPLSAPNPCAGGRAAAVACFLSILPGFAIPYGPTDATANFWISYEISYHEKDGLTMSDIRWSNQYPGKAIFNSVKINNRVVNGNQTYMNVTGLSQQIVGTGGSYHDYERVQIEIMITSVINTPNGIGGLPAIWKLPPIPSINEFRDLLRN